MKLWGLLRPRYEDTDTRFDHRAAESKGAMMGRMEDGIMQKFQSYFWDD